MSKKPLLLLGSWSVLLFAGLHPVDSGTEQGVVSDSTLLARLWIFTSVDCPIANSYSPEINRLYDDYHHRGVEILLVYPDPALSEQDVKTHRADYQLQPPALLDPQHHKVRRTGASITPEAVLLTASGELVYRGKIDNRYAGIGKRRAAATEHYVRDLLDQILAGQHPAYQETEAIGCRIEPLPKAE